MEAYGKSRFNKKTLFLEKEDIQWVEDTIAGMATEEKIGQLFVNMGSERSEEYPERCFRKISHRCGALQPGTSKDVHEQNRILQENAKVPLLSQQIPKRVETEPVPMEQRLA